MGGSGRDGDAAAAIWRAAADTLAWTASMHDHMAQTERRTAWAAKSEAAAAMDRAATECGDAIGADGVVDTAATSRAAEAARGAADATRRAADAFGRSSGRHRDARADQELAVQAYERAADYGRSGTMGERAARSQANAQGAGEMVSGAREAAKTLVRNAGRLEAIAAAQSKQGSGKAGAGDELATMHAGMLDDARRTDRQSSTMEKMAADAEMLAAEVRGLAAFAAEYSMALAAEASDQGLRDPRVKRAAAALKAAVASASRLAAAEERRRMEDEAE